MNNQILNQTSITKQQVINFTLIELLVVITIVTTLTSLLLPALATAREKAKRAVCSSNLRQVALALVGYADSFRENLPYSASGLKTLCDNHSLTPKIFLCPSDKLNKIERIDGYFHNRNNSVSASYQFVNYYRALENKLSLKISFPGKYAMEWDLFGGSYAPENAIKRNHNIAGGNVIYFDLHLKWLSRPLWFRDNKPVYMP